MSWKHYDIPLGDFFAGSMEYLVFVNRSDMQGIDHESFFRNVVVFDRPINKADLVIESYTMNPTNPTTKDTINFTAVVKNIGIGGSEESMLSLRVGGESTPPKYDVPTLTPGDSFTVVRKAVLPIAQGYLSEVIADVDNKVAESNEANNTDTLVFSVQEAPKPDLIIESYTMSPTSPNTEDTITFTTVVKNLGPGSSGSSLLSVRVGSESSPAHLNTLYQP